MRCPVPDAMVVAAGVPPAWLSASRVPSSGFPVGQKAGVPGTPWRYDHAPGPHHDVMPSWSSAVQSEGPRRGQGQRQRQGTGKAQAIRVSDRRQRQLSATASENSIRGSGREQRTASAPGDSGRCAQLSSVHCFRAADAVDRPRYPFLPPPWALVFGAVRIVCARAHGYLQMCLDSQLGRCEKIHTPCSPMVAALSLSSGCASVF
jgi:hypothetical protein